MLALRWRLPVLATGLLLAGACVAQAQRAPRAQLITLAGAVEVQRGGQGVWLPVRAPADRRLYPGDHVQTLQRAQATIAIDTAQVWLGPRTEVIIPPAPRRGGARTVSRLRALAGRIRIWLFGARDLEVGTAGAVAGARGTRFVLDIGDNGLTTVTVLEGAVDFYNDLGRVLVAEGQQSAAAAGVAPSRPKAVDLSGYLEWEATLDSVWMGFETRHHPSETRARLRERATEAAQQALGNPNDPQAQSHAGDLLHDLGDLTGAEEAYRKALSLEPDNAGTHLSLGYTLLQQGRRTEADAELEAAGRPAPESPDPLVGQAAAAVLAGTPEGQAKAQALLDQALKLDARHPLAHVVAGLLAMRRGVATAAEEALRQAIAADPSTFQAHAYLATVRLAQSDPTSALEAARRAVELAPASGLAHESLATALFFTGASEEARQEVDLALEADPNSPAAHLLAADLALQAGDLDAALEEAQLSLALDPFFAPAYSLVGMISLAQNDLRHAEKAFARALGLSPNLVAARTGMGVTYQRQGKLAEALRTQQAAISLDPGAASVRNNTGAVHLAQGRLEEAVEEFKQAIALQPEWPMPYANLALAYLELNRFADSVREAETAVRLGDDSARLHTTLARDYLKQNRVNRAWAELRRAIDLDADWALAHLEIAEVYTRQGRFRDALREQTEALARQPASIIETRAYARTEARVQGGSFAGALRTEGVTDAGQAVYYATVQHERSDWDRPHSDWQRTSGLLILGRQPTENRTSVLHLSTQDEERERPGPVIDGRAPSDPDFESTFRGREGYWLTRFPAGDDGRVTVKLGFRSSSLHDRNPDSLAGDPKPFRRMQVRLDGPLGEVRLDQRFSSRARLVAGVAVSGEEREVSGLVGTPNPPGAPEPVTWTPFSESDQRNAATLYLEHTQRLSDRTALMLGGRAAIAQGMSPVWRPKAWLRHEIGRRATLVLLTRPLLRDDVSEISPVDHWALGDWLSPLDLGTGGFSQSYELHYQLMPRNGSLLRVAGFHRTLRNLIVDLQDPRLAPGEIGTVLARGSLTGAEAEWEQWLTREISAGALVRYTAADNDDAPGLDLPLQPHLTSQVRLDYLDEQGYRGSVVWVHAGERFGDLANELELPAFDVVNLSLARQLDLHTDIFVVVDNLFDEEYSLWPSYPAPGRRVRGGVLCRF